GDNSTTAAGVANFGLDANNQPVFVKNAKNNPNGGFQLGDFLIAKLRSDNFTPFTPVWALKGGDDTINVDPNSEDETRGIALDANGDLYVTGFRQANAPNPF